MKRFFRFIGCQEGNQQGSRTGASYRVAAMSDAESPSGLGLRCYLQRMGGLPDWLEPMAATLTQERFTGDDWLFERKFDGIRLLAYKDGADVQLFSRNRLLQNHAYPDFANVIAGLPHDNLILDGEALGIWGPHNEAVSYHVYDLLWLGGRDLTKLTLDERTALLDTVPLRAPLSRVERLTDQQPWERACAEGWEGVIAKRRDSRYEHRRSPFWLKMKCEASQEFVVGGFTDPRRSRAGFGALLLGYYDGDDLVFAGKVGTGFDTRMLLDLRTRLDAIEVAHSPFTRGDGLPRLGAHWVQLELVVQVAFIEWTGHGKLRHPRLLGLRIDKAPADVVRETP
jgi:bifunctional non-homologous end joining protein LigD